MSGLRETDVRDAPNRNAERPPPLVHLWPRDPRYRLSLADHPQPGDIARCGRVKKGTSGRGRGLPVSCVVCAALAEGRSS